MPDGSAFFDLYLDESGDFRETSSDAAERRESLARARPFASQLAGLLVPRGSLDRNSARNILRTALSGAGLPFQPVHANQLPRDAYDRVVLSVVEQVGRKGWQIVRLVNRERVQYGDRAATYTNLVAELVLRICRQKQLDGLPRVGLRLVCAAVKLGERADGSPIILERDEYQKRVREYLGFVAVRRGLARESANWRLDELVLGSGRHDEDLQLCDVVSNACHDDFHPCSRATAEALRASFGPYDFSLVHRELIERVDQLLAEDLYGLAILALAEELVGTSLAPDARAVAGERLREARGRLAQLGSPSRDPHLRLLIDWLEQLIEVQRSLETGYRVARFLQEELVGRSPNQDGLEWFRFALHTFALTAANHRGAPAEARREADALAALLPALGGMWEHSTLLMRGLIAEAVHRTDCFQHAAACARMKLVADHYGELGSLFNTVLPEVFPERIRSDMRGRALGTWLQGEIYAGLQHPESGHFEQARKLSEPALDEFPSRADRARQHQYRAQLETAAGCFDEARRHLATSLETASHDHLAIGETVRGLGDVSATAQGFSLLHWFRLGTTALLDGAREEGEAFLDAVKRTKATGWTWSRGEDHEDYPVHGILRRAAVIHAWNDEPGQAMARLQRLAELLSGPASSQVVLQAIRLSAHAEVGSLLWERHRKQAERVLSELLELLESLRRGCESFPELWNAFASWPASVETLLSSGVGESELSRLARQVGY